MKKRPVAIFLLAISVFFAYNFTRIEQAFSSLFIPKFTVSMAYYAIMSKYWPCDASMSVFVKAKLPQMSFLWDRYFGDETACIDKFMQLPQKKRIEIHLINEVCMKSKRCPKESVGYGLGKDSYQKKLLAKDPVLMGKIDTAFGNVANWLNTWDPSTYSCYVSPGLESNLTNIKAVNILIDKTSQFFPNCRIVFNGRFRIRDVHREYHGKPAASGVSSPCLINLDGTDIDFPFRRSTYRNNHVDSKNLNSYIDKYDHKCDSVGLWVSEFNLRKTATGKSTPRNRKDVPSNKIFNEMKKYVNVYHHTIPDTLEIK